MNTDKKTVGIIGYGNMGSAIADRIKQKYEVLVFDKDNSRTINLSGIKAATGNVDLVVKSDIVILAVKPQDFGVLLKEIKDFVKDKLVISIAAGKKTASIENVLGASRVIRVMPNLAAKIGEAESSLCGGRYIKEGDLDFARELFHHIGKTWVMDEDMIDAATAIAGSGPAYIYYDMEQHGIDPLKVSPGIKQEYIIRLTEAAKKVGIDSDIAFDLAACTTDSSIRLAEITSMPLSELRKQITSKGGTTEAALEVLANGGSWADAAVAAKKRAEELSTKE